MLKKRLIFTFLYSNGYFVQSRNFNLQNVGDLNWIKKNYKLTNISNFIDELIVIDILKNQKNQKKFIKNLKEISNNFFIPITAGGGIKNLEDAKNLLENGADKVIVNSMLFENINKINDIAKVYGSQSIIGSLDYKYYNNNVLLFSSNGENLIKKPFSFLIKKLNKLNLGEILLHSIDKDGTGMGLDLNILKYIKKNIKKPIIISGGCGNYLHIVEGLKNKKINAVVTSNLFNFINDGLELARKQMYKKKIELTNWNPEKIKSLKNLFSKK